MFWTESTTASPWIWRSQTRANLVTGSFYVLRYLDDIAPFTNNTRHLLFTPT